VTGHAIETYLSDHLAGAMFGSNLAEQIRDRSEGAQLRELMEWLAPEIEEDRQTLIEVMEKLDVARSPIKEATTWLAEKASRVKFAGGTAHETEVGTFMALETLRLGVEGKLCLWTALRVVSGDLPALRSIDLGALIERAVTQRDRLELERIEAGRAALTNDT
jgi:hypothetical protein